MLHNRVESQSIGKYNEIIRAFIDTIVESKVKIDVASKVQCVPFYVALMVGDQA